MNDFPPDEPRYTRTVAAQLANISIELLERCEVEQLVRVRVIRGGSPGYSARDVRQLARIGRLYQDLGLDLSAMEIVLNMRRQILDLQEQIERQEWEMARREEQLIGELIDLRRRLAIEVGRSQTS